MGSQDTYFVGTMKVVGRIYQQTFIDTYSRVAFAKLYTSLDELQQDVESWLREYNELRPYSGKYCYGKTPIKTMNDAAYLAKEKVLDNQFKPHKDDLSSSEDMLSSRGTALLDQNEKSFDRNWRA